MVSQSHNALVLTPPFRKVEERERKEKKRVERTDHDRVVLSLVVERKRKRTS